MNITWLGETACNDPHLVGGKAANLSILTKVFTVPPGFCLTTEALSATDMNGSAKSGLPAGISAEIERSYSELIALTGESVGMAVRSSAVDEDGADDSFAGQHETYLNVTGVDNLKEAVRQCWESRHSERAMAYRAERGIDAVDVRLAVLVQQLVEADTSAVVFSINPITGNEDEIVITANWGLGESIVGGTVSPDTIIFRKSDLRLKSQQIGAKEQMTVRTQRGCREVQVPRILRSQPAIGDAQALEIARLALDLELRMGWPVDVECAYRGERLYLLQCRPVTTAPSPHPVTSESIAVPADFPVTWSDPQDEILHWIHDSMHDPVPLRPLEMDLGMVTDGINLSFDHHGVPVQFRSQVFNGYLYSASVPRLPPEQVEIQTKRAEDTIRNIASKMDTLWENEWFPEIQSILAGWDGFDLKSASMDGLLEHLDETLDRARDMWFLHFRIVEPLYLAMGLFDELYGDLFEDDGSFGAMALLQGLENKTVETAHALWDLSRTLPPHLTEVFRVVEAPYLITALQAIPDAEDFLDDFEEYLEEYGERGDLWSIVATSWVEDPTPALKSFKEYIANPDRNPRAELEALAEKRKQALATAREKLFGYPRPIVDSFEHALQAAQTGTVLSEDHGFWIDAKGMYRVRRVFMEFGRRFADAGIIAEADDIFFLRLDEIRAIAVAEKKTDLGDLITQRKADLAYFETLDAPDALGTEQGPPPDSLMERSGEKFFGAPPPSSDDPSVLYGNAGSPGKVRGRARILRSITQADELQPGEILIATTTAPSWTPLFAVAAAVVTDTGGILSHCAVVAREYEIPAVVGVGKATDVIETGQLVEVDGEGGIVRIL